MEPFVRRYNLDNRRFALVRTADADRIEAMFHGLSATHSLVSGRIEGVIDSGPEGRLTLSLDWQWLGGRTGRGAALFSEW